MVWNDRLKELRQGSGVSLKEMAALVGVSEATAQRYESGYIHQVPYEVIVAYADKFGVSPSYVMGWSDAPSTPSPLSPPERELIGDYRALNDTGKDEARKRVRELTEIERYTETEKNDTASQSA